MAGAAFAATQIKAQTSTSSGTDYQGAMNQMLSSFNIGSSSSGFNCSQATIDSVSAALTQISLQIQQIVAQVTGLTQSQAAFLTDKMTAAAHPSENMSGIATGTAITPTLDASGNVMCAQTGEPIYLSYLPWNGTQATTCCNPNDGIKPMSYQKLPDQATTICLSPIGAAGAYCVAGWDQRCGNGFCDSDENRCNCPQDCMPTSPKTCAEACKDKGYGSGYCDMGKYMMGVETVYTRGCWGDQLDNNFSSDCKLTTGLTDELRACCCVGKPMPFCMKEGQGITLFQEAAAGASLADMRAAYHVLGLRNEFCCAGLTAIKVSGLSKNGECTSAARPTSGPVRLNNKATSEHYVCANCGNGICGAGENKCNCPADCH